MSDKSDSDVESVDSAEREARLKAEEEEEIRRHQEKMAKRAEGGTNQFRSSKGFKTQ